MPGIVTADSEAITVDSVNFTVDSFSPMLQPAPERPTPGRDVLRVPLPSPFASATYVGLGITPQIRDVLSTRPATCAWSTTRRPWASTPGNGVTDDTAALQSAITAGQSVAAQGGGRRIVLPAGNCLTGTLLISGQTDIRGAGSRATVPRLKASATGPAIRIETSGYDFVQLDGYPNGNISISHLRLTSTSGATSGLDAYEQWNPAFLLQRRWGHSLRTVVRLTYLT